jgi:hypothetical protein
MTEESIARRTLRKARFFAEQAEQSKVGQREAFETQLEAAIVFGRSVTFHIQKEFAHEEGFEDWYSLHQNKLKNDSVATFFHERRNFILKQGPVNIHKIIIAEIHETVNVSCTVEAKVIRGQPWYRRSISALWSDFKMPFVGWINRRRQRRELERTRAKTSQEPESKVTDEYFFLDQEWPKRPALELLNEWLDKLEIIVNDAERKFAAGSRGFDR